MQNNDAIKNDYFIVLIIAKSNRSFMALKLLEVQDRPSGYHDIRLQDYKKEGAYSIAMNMGKNAYDNFFDHLVKLDDSKPLRITIEAKSGCIFKLQKIIRNLKRRKRVIAIIPKFAHESGALLALSCDEIYMSQTATLSGFEPKLKQAVHSIKTTNVKFFAECYSQNKEQSRTIISTYIDKIYNEKSNICKQFLNRRLPEDTKNMIMQDMFYNVPNDGAKLFYFDDLVKIGVNVSLLK